MARLLDAATTEYLYHAGGVITAAPLTISSWIYYTGDADWTEHTVASITDYDQSSQGDGWMLIYIQRGDPGTVRVKAAAMTTWGVRHVETGDIALAASTWHHIGMVVHAADFSDVSAWYNGTEVNDTPAALTPGTGEDRIGVGAHFVGSAVSGNTFPGNLAEQGFWNLALSDEEMVALSKGYSPLLVRPASLKHYMALIRDEDFDRMSSDYLTANGTPTIATHPPKIIYPSPKLWIPAAAAAPAGVAPTGALYGSLMGPLGGPI